MEPWILFALVGAIIVVVALTARWREKRYTEAWQHTAEQLGLAYYGEENDLLPRFGRLATLSRGRRQQIRNAIVGVDGDWEVILADFRYVTGSGKNTRRHAETVCLLHNPTLSLPTCFLRPQSRFLDYLGKFFGAQDIDIPEDPEFSRAYVLQGHVPEAIGRLFGDSLRAWFVERRGKNFCFEAQREAIAFHCRRKIPPDQARDLIAQALQLRKLVTCSA